MILLDFNVGFERNIVKKINREAKFCKQLLEECSRRYKVCYVNLSLGVVDVTW